MSIDEKEKQSVLEKFEQLNNLSSSFRKESIIYTLSNSIIETLKASFDDVFSEDKNIYQRAHALRYLFEALISTSLLVKEENYKEKLFYSYYIQQINKQELVIEKAEREIKELEEIEIQIKKIQEEYIPKIAGANKSSQSPKDLMEEMTQKEDQLYDKLEKQPTLFTKEAKSNGAGFQAHLVREQNLNIYQENLKKIKEEFHNIVNNLAKDQGFNKRFDVKYQASKVQKVLKDNRNWSNKALEVGLSEEYRFVYNYTSSILHFTSYSFFTRNDVPAGESNVISRLALKYISNILSNLYSFMQIPEGVNVIAVKN